MGKIKYHQLKNIAWLLLSFPINQYAQLPIATDPQYAGRIWYDKASVNGYEALPLGNGRIGAMT